MKKILRKLGATLSSWGAEPEQPIIEFICRPEDFGVLAPPVPAYKAIPDWFKKLETHFKGARDGYGAPVMSAKKCLPMLDAMSLGYVIPLWGTAHIQTNETNSVISPFANQYAPILQGHPAYQVGGVGGPLRVPPYGAFKFINRWIVKTRPGYSCLFMPLINVPDERFTMLSAVVDTDVYVKEVNFPGIWHKKSADDTLDAGFPLIAVIPFRRDQIPRDIIVRAMDAAEVAYMQLLERKQAAAVHVYTGELREARK